MFPNTFYKRFNYDESFITRTIVEGICSAFMLAFASYWDRFWWCAGCMDARCGREPEDTATKSDVKVFVFVYLLDLANLANRLNLKQYLQITAR